MANKRGKGKKKASGNGNPTRTRNQPTARGIPKQINSNNGTGTMVIDVVKEFSDLGANQQWGSNQYHISATAFPKLVDVATHWHTARITKVTGTLINGLSGAQGTCFVILENFARTINTQALFMSAGAKIYPLTRNVIPITSPIALNVNLATSNTTDYGWVLSYGAHCSIPIEQARSLGVMRLSITLFCQGPK